MNLSPQDVAVYYRVQHALLDFANERFCILDGPVGAAEEATPELIQLRDRLYQAQGLLDEFVAANPAGFTDAELHLVLSWKRRVMGRFVILRFLRRYAIFIDGRGQVYGVLGLSAPLFAVIEALPPLFVDAVLLPFHGRIIYDGYLIKYPISLGGGVRRIYEETYQRARQKGLIQTSLDPAEDASAAATDASATSPRKSAHLLADPRPLTEEIAERVASLRAPDGVVQSKSFQVLKASAALAQHASSAPSDLEHLSKLSHTVWRALKQLETAITRER